MSKQIKEMMMRDYVSRVAGFQDAMVVSIRGMSAIDTNKVRAALRPKQIKIQVVRNALARKAFEGSGLENLKSVLEGPSALAFGGQSIVEVAREIVKLLEKFPKLELKGAVLDGTLFEGKDGVTELSKFPTREEAVGQVITLIVSPARKLVAQVQGPGSALVGIISAIETKLEKGEAIAKAG